jgi:hypothetical protein
LGHHPKEQQEPGNENENAKRSTVQEAGCVHRNTCCLTIKLRDSDETRAGRQGKSVKSQALTP